ncbi:hypothetical protein BT96DRAFT_75019 [Gymnopus androsaceus JB14]|uniref:F-box domain-containing protein n=1 Tax=Gymnopus androsaceus JB14 TaxID=1447944 RepID=A0A6A4HIT2_9AGAR|nr:hypothetical protein BT96DRAFT_75019 [Gymnopus androsaceus JB14]
MKQKNERRLPDEIFALIIEWLDDQTSLQNTALVCKDFTFFSQQCFFKEIDFGDNSYMTEGRFPWISRFVALLRDPHSGFLGNFVQKLDFWGYPVGREPEDLEADMKSILQALPFLTKLMIESPSLQLFRAIGMFLGGKLEELWLDGVYLGGLDEFRIFQGMLTSLTALKSLSIRHCTGLKDQVLALPTSLRAASFALTDESILHAIGLGMEAPSQISTLFLDFDTGVNDYSILWRVLGLDTVVVLDVGTARQHTFVPAMDIFAQGLRVRRTHNNLLSNDFRCRVLRSVHSQPF